MSVRLSKIVLQNEQQKVAHLLRRFGLGASEAEVDYYGKDGLAGAIEQLLDYKNVDEGFPLVIKDFENQNGNINMIAVQSWWYIRLLATKRPLEQKLTVFWHDHFATSASKVDIGLTMHKHIETIRENATSTFPQLLSAVSKDPGMIFWLDTQYNVNGTPNENFAREVMELFTLGVDNGYTEDDILEAARAFTGWTFAVQRGRQIRRVGRPVPIAKFYYDEQKHDESVKHVLGKSGNFDGDDVLRILCEETATAHNITKKMWEWFAYEDPDVNLVARLATNWIKKDLDIKFLVRSIMESDEFYSDKAIRKQIKSPIDFCISSLRALGVGKKIIEARESAQTEQQKRRVIFTGRLVAQKTKAMGMELLYPPDVSGWKSGEEWISSATMIERIKFADTLFGAQRSVRGLIVRELPGAGLPPDEAVDSLLSVFDADLPLEKVAILKESAQKIAGGTVTRATSIELLLSVSRLMFGSPEYQFS